MIEAIGTVRTIDSEADVMEMLNDVLPGKSIPVFTITHAQPLWLTALHSLPSDVVVAFEARWLAARRRTAARWRAVG